MQVKRAVGESWGEGAYLALGRPQLYPHLHQRIFPFADFDLV